MANVSHAEYAEALVGQQQFGVPHRTRTWMGALRRERVPCLPTDASVASYERQIYERLCAGLLGTTHEQYARCLQAEARLFTGPTTDILSDRLYRVLYRHLPALWLPSGRLRDAVLQQWEQSLAAAKSCLARRTGDRRYQLQYLDVQKAGEESLRLDQPARQQRAGYALLCEQVGLPLSGLPTLREMGLLRLFLQQANLLTAPDYLSMQAVVRESLDTGMFAAMALVPEMNHEVLAAVVEAYWGPAYVRRIPSIGAGFRVVEAFGNAGYFPEIGVGVQWNDEDRAWRCFLVRGDGALVGGVPAMALLAHVHFAVPAPVREYATWNLATAPTLTSQGWGGQQQWPALFSTTDIGGDMITAMAVEQRIIGGVCAPPPHRHLIDGVPTYDSWIVTKYGITRMQLRIPLSIRIDIGLRDPPFPDAELRHRIASLEKAITMYPCTVRIVPFADMYAWWQDTALRENTPLQ